MKTYNFINYHYDIITLTLFLLDLYSYRDSFTIFVRKVENQSYEKNIFVVSYYNYLYKL